jgi:hypothetical protein
MSIWKTNLETLPGGLDPLPFAAYVLLAEMLFKNPDLMHTAADLFLLFEWNLILCASVDYIVNCIEMKNIMYS